MNKFQENWNEMAKAYDDFTRGNESYSCRIELPCVKSLLPDLRGKMILDLGGGTGGYGTLFSEYHPAEVRIIDISEKMLDIGRKRAEACDANIIFEKGDICDIGDLPGDGFDFIFSSTAFHYLPDLYRAFRNVYRLLKNGGQAIISVMHPIYTGQYPIDKNGVFPSDDEWELRYLDRSIRSYIQPWIEYNDEIPDFLSSSFHYTVSDYINAIIESGLRIQRIEEPLPPDGWKAEQKEKYDACIEAPIFLIFSLAK